MVSVSGFFHLVEQQDGGREHVHSIILTRDEAVEELAAELTMHLFGGWKVRPIYDTAGVLAAVRLRHTKEDGSVTERLITYREFDQPEPGAVYPHEC